MFHFLSPRTAPVCGTPPSSTAHGFIARAVTMSLLLGCAVLACDDHHKAASQSQTEAADEETPASTPSPASTVQSDIAAVVNDREITIAEVDRRLDRLGELYRHSRQPFDEATRLDKREKVVQRLVDRELLRQHIADHDIEIESSIVDDQLQERIDTQFGSASAFHRYLDAQDLSIGDYRRRIREELALEQLITDRVDADAIDEQQLRKYYERIANRRPAQPRVHVTSVTIELDDAAEPEFHPSIREIIDKRLQRADDPDELADLQDELGADANIRIDDRRWLQRHQLPHPKDQKALFTADAPSQGATPVVETSNGIRLHWVHDRREAGIRQFDEVEDLVRDRAYRSQLLRHRHELLEQLRSDASITVHLSDD